jgi:thiamine biosynthesis protein ThiS
MKLVINGEVHVFDSNIKTIHCVMDVLSLTGKGRIVECNGELIAQDAWKSHSVFSNDILEIIQFMGGG